MSEFSDLFTNFKRSKRMWTSILNAKFEESLSSKLKRKYIEREQRFLTVFKGKDDNDVSDYLRAQAHNLKL